MLGIEFTRAADGGVQALQEFGTVRRGLVLHGVSGFPLPPASTVQPCPLYPSFLPRWHLPPNQRTARQAISCSFSRPFQVSPASKALMYTQSEDTGSIVFYDIPYTIKIGTKSAVGISRGRSGSRYVTRSWPERQAGLERENHW